MGWKDFDWLEAEKDIFASEVREVVLPLYQAATERISQWRRHNEAQYRAAIAEAKDDWAVTDAHGQAAWRETRYDEQEQAVGSLALHHLCTALKLALTDATRFFKQSHPRSAGAYSGEHWLARLKNEYVCRFGVDFDKAPVPIERIEELALARNAGLHWEGDALREYEEKVSEPRFLESGIVKVSPQQLDAAISDAQRFVGWAVDQLRQLAQGQKP
jgi:hypothetical protein